MQKTKILVVDDEHADRMRHHLENCGFEVSIAEDGGKAVELAAASSPDLVLLDIQLPVLDGYEVLEELKRRRIATRVVMYSGYFTDLETAIRCVRSGACDFISKAELNMNQLVEKVKRYVILEKTLNLQVSDLTPIVEKLISESEAHSKRAEKVSRELRSLQARKATFEVLVKLTYLVASLASVYFLVKRGLVSPGLSMAVLFLMLLVFLLIPTGQLKNVSAALKDLKAKIELK